MTAAAPSHPPHAETSAPRWGVELLAAGAALALFVGLLYYRLLFTNRVLASGDILHYFYPYRDYASAALREGRIPLWNPYIFLGAPFLANPQAAALYPLHWPLSWLAVTKQVAWSAALHTWLLGMGGYVLLRRWRGSVWAATATALALAGSGFYGGLLGHINQMNGAAWLPWAALVVDMDADLDGGGMGMNWRSHLLRPEMLLRVALFALLTALMVLAGHTQTVYINLFGLGAWVTWPLARSLWAQRTMAGLRAGWRACAPRLFIYAAGCALALLISGAQLLPALELSALGLRSDGVSYAEASSFSLKPLHLLWTLLPSYGLADLSVVFDTLGYTEYVAYVGLLGLALAVVGAWRGRGPAREFGLLMAALGLFLALGRWNPVYYVLYRLMPGFDLFRAPARWMMLYTLGMAVLAGAGVDVTLSRLRRRMPGGLPLRRAMAAALVGLLGVELIMAARSLPHTHPTAPQAVYDLRTAPAYLLTDPARHGGRTRRRGPLSEHEHAHVRPRRYGRLSPHLRGRRRRPNWMRPPLPTWLWRSRRRRSWPRTWPFCGVFPVWMGLTAACCPCAAIWTCWNCSSLRRIWCRTGVCASNCRTCPTPICSTCSTSSM